MKNLNEMGVMELRSNEMNEVEGGNWGMAASLCRLFPYFSPRMTLFA